MSRSFVHAIVATASGLLLLLLLLAFLPPRLSIRQGVLIDRPLAAVHAQLSSYATRSGWPTTPVTLRLSGPQRGPGALLQTDTEQWLISAVLEQRRVVEERQTAALGPLRLTWTLLPTPSGSEVEAELRIDHSEQWWPRLEARLAQGRYAAYLAAEIEALQLAAERLSAVDYADAEIAVVEVPPVALLYVSADAVAEPRAVEAALGAAYRKLVEYMTRHQIVRLGQPLAITNAVAAESGRYAFDAAFAVMLTALPVADGDVKLGVGYHGPALRVIHRGDYGSLAQSYAKAHAWLLAHGQQSGGRSWEHYVSDPGLTPEAERLTHLYFPLPDWRHNN